MPYFISNATFLEISEILLSGQKLLAVKMYKAATNCNLRDAKLAIDNWEVQKSFINDEKAGLETEKPDAESFDKIYTFLLTGKRNMALEYISRIYFIEEKEADAYLLSLEKGKMPKPEWYEQKEMPSEAEIKAKIVGFIKQNQKLQAIKELKTSLSFSLTEAIEYTNKLAEEIEEEPPPTNEQKKEGYFTSQNVENEENTEERIGKMIFWGMIGILMYITWWMWG